MRFIGNDPKTPRQTQVVASGTLSTGDTVVVNSDGTVSAISGSSFSETVGTPTVFETGTTSYISAVYDANAQKVVVGYRDVSSSNVGTAVVGTVSGTSISFGSPLVFESGATNYLASAYDAVAQKVVFAYQDGGNGNKGTAIVGTVSGTSISFGSATVFDINQCTYVSATYDPDSQKVIVAYRGSSNGAAVVGTVSGTSITFGSVSTYNSSSAQYNSITYDANAQKVVVAYQDVGNSNYGTAAVGTVSGTSISFGTSVVFEAATTQEISATYDANAQKIVIGYSDGGNSYYGTGIVGTVSGTSISFGSPVVFTSTYIFSPSAAYNSDAKKVAIAYRDFGNSSYGTVTIGTVSGTSITFTTPTVYEAAATRAQSTIYDPDSNKIVISYQDTGNSSYGTSVVYQPAYTSTNITAENFIGTAQTGAGDGNGAVINITGAIDENQSGLTAGQSYYVQNDGSLGTTAADPSVFAGTAVSATKLIVKG